MTAQTALESVTRTMAVALGVGSLAFFLLALAPMIRQTAAFGAPWTTAAALGMFAPMMVAGLLSRWLSTRAIRVFAGVAAVAQLLTLATLTLVLPDATLPEQLGSPWPIGATVVGAASAAIAWPAAITWPYALICVALVGFDRAFASARPIADLAAQDALHTLLFTALFTALALGIRRAGLQLDRESDLAVVETRQLAQAEARVRERKRFEALVHDSVLVALLASVRRSDRAAAQADEALTRLATIERGETDDLPGSVDARAWLWHLQGAATDLAPAARFSYEERDAEPVPAEVAEAILEATAEALRNSMQHAGPASRAVHVRLAPGALEVTVLDDGRGFDPGSVAEARLGVAVSIRERMRLIPGGRAVVVSEPGLGTRVTIGWTR